METLRRGVSDCYDDHAGRTVVGTTVRHMCPLKETWKKMENLRGGVSDRSDGHAGWTVVGKTVRHMCPLRETWKKNEKPLETGSLSSMTIMHDGPSRGRQSVTCVQ